MPDNNQGQVVGRGIFQLLINKMGFTKDLDDASDQFKRKLSEMGAVAKGLGPILAGAVGVGLIAAIDQSVKKLIEMGEQVRRLKGLMAASAEETSAFIQLSEKAGVNTELFARAMTMLNFQIEATAKAAHLTDTRLGAVLGTIRNSQGQVLTTSEAFQSLADHIKNARSAAEQTSIATAVLGRRIGARLLPALRLGADGFREAFKEAQRLGLMFSEEKLENIRKYKVAQHELNEAFEAFQVQIGTAVLPKLTAFIASMAEGAQKVSAFIESHKAMFQFLTSLAAQAGVLLAIAGGFSLVGKAVEFLRQNIPGLNAAIANFTEKMVASKVSTDSETVAIQRNTAAQLENAAARGAVSVAATERAMATAPVAAGGLQGLRTGAAGILGGLGITSIASAISTTMIVGISAYVMQSVLKTLRDARFGAPGEGGFFGGFTPGENLTLLGTRIFGGRGAEEREMRNIATQQALADQEKRNKEYLSKTAQEREESVSGLFKAAQESKRTGESFEEFSKKMKLAIETAKKTAEVPGTKLADTFRVKAIEAEISLEKERLQITKVRAELGLVSGKDILQQLERQLDLARQLKGDTQDTSELELSIMKEITKEKERQLQLREFELKSIGAFGAEQELAQLETKAEIAVGDERLKIEAEIFERRKKLTEEALKLEVELGLKSRKDQIEYNRQEISRLFSTGQFTEAGRLIVETTKLAMEELSDQFEFEKHLREKTHQELLDFYGAKLQMVKGNASEEKKFLGEVADEERRFLDERLKANITYLDQVDKSTKLTQKLAGTPIRKRETLQQQQFEADIEERENLETLIGAARGGFDPALRAEMVSTVQTYLTQFAGMRRRGEPLSYYQDRAYDAFTDFMKTINRGQEIYDPRKGIDAARVVGMYDGAINTGTSTATEIPKLSSEYSDLIRTWKDASAATIGSITSLRVAFDSLASRISQLAGGALLPPPTIPAQSFIGPGGVSNQALVTPQQVAVAPIQQVGSSFSNVGLPENQPSSATTFSRFPSAETVSVSTFKRLDVLTDKLDHLAEEVRNLASSASKSKDVNVSVESNDEKFKVFVNDVVGQNIAQGSLAQG